MMMLMPRRSPERESVDQPIQAGDLVELASVDRGREVTSREAESGRIAELIADLRTAPVKRPSKRKPR